MPSQSIAGAQGLLLVKLRLQLCSGQGSSHLQRIKRSQQYSILASMCRYELEWIRELRGREMILFCLREWSRYEYKGADFQMPSYNTDCELEAASFLSTYHLNSSTFLCSLEDNISFFELHKKVCRFLLRFEFYYI